MSTHQFAMNPRPLFPEHSGYGVCFARLRSWILNVLHYRDDLPPLSDRNNWYYPSHGYESDEEDLQVGSKGGNWGNKTVRGARWVRKGKITPWGLGMDDWEVRYCLS